MCWISADCADFTDKDAGAEIHCKLLPSAGPLCVARVCDAIQPAGRDRRRRIRRLECRAALRASRSRSRSSTAAISTCFSRCCTRWPPAACRRPTSPLRSAPCSAGKRNAPCCWRKRRTSTSRGASSSSRDRRIPYDSLIVATGSRITTSATPNGSNGAPGLKTIEDATEIRRRMLLAFEAAEREPDPARRAAWLTFVVVGAGPTGVELAGAVARAGPPHA